MSRLIDADALLALCKSKRWTLASLKTIKDQPTIDAVEVVRCKDCKHFAGEGMYCAQDIIVQYDHFYCYHGERKDDE